jgi:hypothetical protein
MGVVSLLQENQRSNALLKKLRAEHRVAVLFEQEGEECIPQPEDIYRLVNFLAILRFRGAARDGRLGINMNLVR